MNQTEKDYILFLNSGKPGNKDSSVLNKLLRKLNPSFTKTFFIHLSILFSAGLLTLLVCPQFGMGGILFGHHFIHFIASGGQVLCGIFCASVYFLSAMSLSHIFLPASYKRTIQHHAGVFAFSVPAILMGIMMLSAAAIGQFAVMGFIFCLSWYLASLIIHFVFTNLWKPYALT